MDMELKEPWPLLLHKKGDKAAKAYVTQAGILSNLGQDYETSSAYVSAAVCYKKINPIYAIECYNKSIEICKKTGRLHLAASNMKQVAELYVSEVGDKGEAVKAYVNAASWYFAEDSTAQASSCILKAAHLEAELGKFDDAIAHFEEAIENTKSDRLTRFSLREYFFKASLCRMCTGDFEGAQAASAEYKKIDETYVGTRECDFIDKILRVALETRDVDQFVEITSSWDKITRIDSWKANLLLRIKDNISRVDYT